MNLPFDIYGLRDRLLPVEANHPSGAALQDAAVAVIIDPKEQGGAILLIHRIEREGDRWSGQIAFPGGHRVSSDRNLLETAIRETAEEVGVFLLQHEMLGALPLVMSRSGDVNVAPFVFQLKAGIEIQPNAEVADAFWLALADIVNSEIIQSEVCTRGRRLVTDSYIYKGRVIWGLTFRIINLLIGRSVNPE
jgi:8-oxo-dGTP pyrophosphatase MutT (NUDIX family)